jgi:hypothetical protein
MKNLNFEQASLLIGRKGVQVLNENQEVINSWVQFFTAQRYYTDPENLSLIKAS